MCVESATDEFAAVAGYGSVTQGPGVWVVSYGEGRT
jgi:hypothetical protein